ncbi:NurA domain protein [Candidatus Gugararchaeum adminiculabundum]|nr:NurA domain protein [Candidatus Gugararchaeum adminiculabundum]
MYERLAEIVKGIEELERQRGELSERLRSKSELFPEALEKELTKKIEPKKLNLKVAAVDGGLLAQEFHGFDLVVARAVAVLFEYQDSLLAGHKYHPRAFAEVEIDVMSALESHDYNWHKGLFRLKKELEIACEGVEKFEPEFMLLDGSIVPLVSDKPADDSPVHGSYVQVISLYKKLYETCEKKGCTLAGVIKDSRGKRFVEILQKKFRDERILEKSSDTSLIHFLLKTGERTFAFNYSADPAKNQVLRDLSEWGRKINAFYIKPVEKDRPLRVEFLDGKHSFDEIASVIYSLSRINKNYGYPAVLIEADMRAALDKVELERAYRELFMKLGMRSSIMPLRRDSRPFR